MKVHYDVYAAFLGINSNPINSLHTVHWCVIAQTHSRNEFRVPLSSGYCFRYFINLPRRPLSTESSGMLNLFPIICGNQQSALHDRARNPDNLHFRISRFVWAFRVNEINETNSNALVDLYINKSLMVFYHGKSANSIWQSRWFSFFRVQYNNIIRFQVLIGFLSLGILQRFILQRGFIRPFARQSNYNLQ